MAKKILKTLSNNIGFKLLAVALAFILWVFVYNIDDYDPVKTRKFTVKVTVVNTESLEDKNLCYEVANNTGIVTFSVTDKRSVLDSLTDKDFTATADLSEISIEQQMTSGTVPIRISSNRNITSLKYSGEDKELEVSLEPLMIKQFVIYANAKGTVAKGYTLGDVAVGSQNVIKVSGPESIVSQIAKVVALIDVDGMSQAIHDNVVPTLLTEEGQQINTTRLKLSSETVSVHASILNTKEVTLNILTSGEPKDNYFVTKVESDPAKITVKGSASALNAISSIDISSEALNVTKDTTEDIVTTVDITDFLPEGVSLLSNEAAIITVTISVEEYQTEVFNLSTSNITVNGLSDDYQLSFLVNAVNVKVSGMESVMDKLTMADFKASIDASALTEGVSTVKVDMGLKEDDYNADEVTLSVLVMLKKTEPSETETTTENPEEDITDQENRRNGGGNTN